jgi:hypothetical protein
MVLFGQPERITVTLENPSKQTIELRIIDFNNLTIAPGESSVVSLSVGDMLYGKRISSKENDLEVVVLVIGEEHNGKIINVHKLLKKASR